MDAGAESSESLHSRQLTAAVTLELATVRTLKRGLGMFGIDWSVPCAEVSGVEPGPGLYAWVSGWFPEAVALLDRPVLYVGIGDGDSGFQGRLRAEEGWIHEDAAHIHGRAMYWLGGRAIGGPVHRIDRPVGWQDPVNPPPTWWNESRWDAFVRWIDLEVPSLLKKAEQLCIRIAAHTGYTAPPVNSEHASAWASDAEADWGGWVAAQRLKGPIR
jgi:hypothetical protein